MTKFFVAKLVDDRLHGGRVITYSTISQEEADKCAVLVRDAVVGAVVKK